MGTLEQKIEALLFYKAEPVSFKELATLLHVSASEVEEALETLRTNLEGRGIALVTANQSAELKSAPGMSELIGEIRKEELSRDLGRAAAETLAIILYQGPISRSEIDFIRGVNSTFIVRSLMIRGLIERIINPKDARGFSYRPTHDLLAHLGITRIEELPEYEKIRSELLAFKQQAENQDENVS